MRSLAIQRKMKLLGEQFGRYCSTTIFMSMTKTIVMVLFTAIAHILGRCGGRVYAFNSAAAISRHLQSSTSIVLQQTHKPIHASAYHMNNYYSSILYRRSYITTTTRIYSETDDDNSNEVEPTWTYTPYQPPKTRRPHQRRRFSSDSSESWTVPNHISIPEDQLTISFARASGAGGQNVNKVNTKVEIRFHLDTATWIPHEVRQRLKSNESNRINSQGYMTITSQEYRTQVQNRKDVIKKLQDIIKVSWARPKVRKMRKGLSKKAKENRRENKKRNSMKKESRRRVDF